MSDTSYIQYSKYVALFFFGIYALNLLYIKATSDGLIAPLQNFGGLDAIEQVLVIFVMCIFYVAFVVYKERSAEPAA